MEERKNIPERWEPKELREIEKREQLRLLNQKLVRRKDGWYGFNYSGVFVCLEKDYSDIEAEYIGEMMLRSLERNGWAKMRIGNTVEPIMKLTVGDTIQTLNDYITQSKEEKKRKYREGHPLDSFERFITRIERPSFERATGNKKRGTFDFIRVHVGIITVWHENRKEYIQKHQQEIGERVLKKIAENKTFERMGVPINFLQLSSVTFTQDSMLEFVFELKKI